MLVVEIELLVDRYHATAWDRGANEGEPEWPPSPWRLARALVSAWWRLPVEQRPEADDVDRLLEHLTTPPRFVVPRAVMAHSRHYMPRPSDGKDTLVLDPFVRTADGSVQLVWENVELTEAEQLTLDLLLSGIGYFGRGESPCIARSLTRVRDGGAWIAPLEADSTTSGADVVRVLCLADDVSSAGLSESTAERRQKRLAAAPCGRWVSYVRPRSCLEAPSKVRAQPVAEPVLGIRFAVEGAALPPLTEALRLAERYRAAVLKRADGAPAETILGLRGRTDEGGRLEGHRHAHFLATDENGDRRIDHLTVWCPGGLEGAALHALDFTTLRSWAFDHPIRLVLLETIRESSRGGPLAQARVWRSHTPFLPTRHPKRRSHGMVDRWEAQVLLELDRRSFPRPGAVRQLQVGSAAWGAFRRERDRREPRTGLPALGFEIEFDEPVRGPIALGRHSHFGMGLFLPAA